MTTTTQNYTPVQVLAGLIGLEEKFTGGAFTMKSRESGKQFTYKLKKRLWKGIYYIHCYVQTHYMKFEYIGYYQTGKIIFKGNENNSIQAQGLKWLIKKTREQKTAIISAQSEILHLGKCLKCGKKLTDSESIKMGLGSYCQKSLNL